MISTSLFTAALAIGVSAPAVVATPSPSAPRSNQTMTALPDIQIDPTGEVVIGTQDRYQRMTIPVTVEGQGPFQFMIDTGSQATVVTHGLSEQLQLQSLGTATVVGLASEFPVQVVELNGLEFAAQVFDNISAPLLEARHIGADGILGLDSLQNLRVMIDFRKETIAVDSARELGGNRGYEIVVRARRKLGRLIITNAIIDGAKTSVIIDTGAQSSVGNMALHRKMRGRDEGPSSSVDIHGKTLVGSVNIARSLRIQDMQLHNVPITFTDSPAFDALGLSDRPALILGMANLRLLDRLAIDFESRKVLFDLPSANDRRKRSDRPKRPTRL